jgi:UDP-glucose 4-epimerase
MKTLPFRFFNVFGPNQAPDHDYAAVVPTFISAALRNEPLHINGDGLQSRDFTYVGTVCDVINAALVRRTASTSPVNLAFGTRTSLLQIVNLLEETIGTPLIKVHREERVGDVRHSQADNTLLQDLFPDIQPVPLRDGIEQTVLWLRSYLAANEK